MDGADGAEVARYEAQIKLKSAANWPNTDTDVTTGTSHTFTSLVNGSTYQVRVRTVETGEQTASDWTSPVEGKPQAQWSSNANLSRLTASSATSSGGMYTSLALTPSSFSAATTSYTATVTNARTHAKLTPTVADTGKVTLTVARIVGDERLGERSHLAQRGRQRDHGAVDGRGRNDDEGLHGDRHAGGGLGRIERRSHPRVRRHSHRHLRDAVVPGPPWARRPRRSTLGSTTRRHRGNGCRARCSAGAVARGSHPLPPGRIAASVPRFHRVAPPAGFEASR